MVWSAHRSSSGQGSHRAGPDGAGELFRVTGVGAGVLECRIHFGPGYRVYFGKDGDALIILSGGGTKKRQQQDIETVRDLWREYKRRKRREIRESWL